MNIFLCCSREACWKWVKLSDSTTGTWSLLARHRQLITAQFFLWVTF